MMILALGAVLLALADSCQELRITAADGSVVQGKTMDSDYVANLKWYLVTVNKGTEYEYQKPVNCPRSFMVSAKYNFAFIKAAKDGKWSSATKVGMNDAGLAANMQSFAESKFIEEHNVKGNACAKAVPKTKLVSYVLNTYSSVADIVADLKADTFPTVWDAHEVDSKVSAHFSFTDKTGRGLVLEYTEELGRKYYENTVGVFNNMPDYGWHMTNLRNYLWIRRRDWDDISYKYQDKDYSDAASWTGTGTNGLPGGYSSPDRLVKAAALLHQAETPANVDEAVVSLFHLLNAASIPKGVIEKKDGTTHFTWWILVNDLSRGCMYYRGRTNMSVKQLCLRDIPSDTSWVVVDDGDFKGGISNVAQDLWQY